MQTPQVKDLVYKTAPHQKPQVLAAHTSDLPAIKSGGSQNPFLRLNNLLEWLPELMKALHLLLQFIIKDTTQEQPNRRDA